MPRGLSLERIIACEAPLTGWRFVFVRVIPSPAFPMIAGRLVKRCDLE